MNKHFIEFQDYIFPLEEVQAVQHYYTWYEDKDTKEKRWFSAFFFKNSTNYFKFKEEHYEEIKNILLDYKEKSN